MARTPLFAALAGVLSVASYSPTEALPGQPPFDGKYLAVVNGQWLDAPGAVVPPQTVCLIAVPAAGLSLGDRVYVSGYDSTADAPIVTKSGTNLKRASIGEIGYLTSGVCLVKLSRYAHEIPSTGLTTGAVYVVGTDGAYAKSGDATYPSDPAQVQVVGVALSTTTILGMSLDASLTAPAALGGASDGSGNRLGAVAAETAFSRKVALAANTFVSGTVKTIRARVTIPVGATSDTFALKLKIGSVVICSVPATDYAANNIIDFDVQVCYGADGKIYCTGGANAAGTVAFAASPQDLTVSAAMDVTITSTASQNTADRAQLDYLTVV